MTVPAPTSARVRSPARKRGALRPSGADRQMSSGSYGILRVAEIAHPLRQDLKHEQHKVYEVLLARADNTTRLARIGYKKIADIAGIDKRSVRRAIKDLIALGLVERKPNWGKPATGGRTCQLATEYYLPRLDELRPDILFAPLAEQRVDETPAVVVDVEEGSELDEYEALQDAARDLVMDQLEPRVQEAQGQLDQVADALLDLAERVGQMFVGRGVSELLREAEERRVVAAVAAGRPPPPTPFPDTLRTRLEAIGGAAPRADRNRFRHPGAFEEALRARARWSDAGYAVLGAVTQCSEFSEQVETGIPREGDWRKAVADARMAIYLCDRARELAAGIEGLLAAAEKNWAPLPKPPPPPSPLRIVRNTAPNLRRWDQRHGPWKPPEAWTQRNGDSPAHWLVGRQSWDQAKANNNQKLLDRLRAAGFREDWPDPPA